MHHTVTVNKTYETKYRQTLKQGQSRLSIAAVTTTTGAMTAAHYTTFGF